MIAPRRRRDLERVPQVPSSWGDEDEARLTISAPMGGSDRDREEVVRLSRAHDLSGRHGLMTGVAFVIVGPKVGAKGERQHPRLQVLARRSDGSACAGTRPLGPRDDVASLVESLAREGSGLFPALVGKARDWLAGDAESNVAAVVERVLGTVRSPARDDADDGSSWHDALRQVAPGEGWANARRPRVGDVGVGWRKRIVHRSEDTHKALVTSLAGTETARGRRLVAAFLEGLDPSVAALIETSGVRALVRTSRPGLWEALDPTFGTGAPLGAALRRHPGLDIALGRAWNADPVCFAALDVDEVAWASAVTHGGIEPRHLPLLRACVSAFGADAPKVMASPVHGEDLPVCLVKALVPYPRNWDPRGAEEWRAMARCLKALHHASRVRPSKPDDVLGGGGDWVGLEARLLAAAGTQVVGSAVDGVRDMVGALARQVLAPALSLAGVEARDATTTSLAILGSGRTLARLLELSRAWHAAEARIAAVAAGLPWPRGRRRAWPPAYPDLRMGGFEAVVLTDDAQLADEGRKGANADGSVGLSHCVGGYASECRKGECRILSIRAVDADGTRTRLSTVELVAGPRGAKARQHLGRGNGAPPAEAVAFLGRYLSAIEAGVLDVAKGDLAPRPEVDDPLLEAGYDYTVPGSWEQVRDAWAPLLPRPARAMSPQAFAGAASAFLQGGHGAWSPDAFGGPAWTPRDLGGETRSPAAGIRAS